MKEMKFSRRDFIKGAAGMAGAAAFGALAGFGTEALAADAIYTPGTYSATAAGIGTVIVTMTFSEDKITDVVLNLDGETASIGQAAAEALKAALMENQGAEIDAVSGASITSRAVMEAANKCIMQAKGEIPIEVVEIAPVESETASWLGTEPETPEVDETWDTDILIVGAGNGGMCAAAYAASKGYKFRVIEKAPAMAKVRGWYGVCDSEDALALGEKPMDRAGMLNELKRFSSGKTNLKIWNTWFNESAAMHNFIKGVYAKYQPEMEVQVTVGDEARWPEDQTFFFPVEEHFWGFSQVSRLDMFKQVVEEAGVEIDFNTPMIKLEKNDERVTGVIAQNTDTGKYIRINASKGVLLACGGYPSNPVMMEQLDPVGTAVTTYNNSLPTDTGDGIKAAKWIGAKMQGEAAPMLFDRGIVAPGVDAGYQVTSTGDKVFPATVGQFNVGSQPFLKVNRKGERFTNESGTYDMMSYAAYNQPGGVYASVFDANFYEDAQRFHTIGCSAGTRNGSKESAVGNLEKQAGLGNAFIADTIEELADKLGFTGDAKETFLATIERYNELYDKQQDDDFYKPAYRLSAIKEAPFYGFWMGACLLTTEQGILCDEKARVIDENSDPIEGLFVCGDNAGGFFVNNYPCLMAGIAMGRNMTFAIKAIKVMSGEE